MRLWKEGEKLSKIYQTKERKKQRQRSLQFYKKEKSDWEEGKFDID